MERQEEGQKERWRLVRSGDIDEIEGKMRAAFDALPAVKLAEIRKAHPKEAVRPVVARRFAKGGAIKRIATRPQLGRVQPTCTPSRRAPRRGSCSGTPSVVGALCEATGNAPRGFDPGACAAAARNPHSP